MTDSLDTWTDAEGKQWMPRPFPAGTARGRIAGFNGHAMRLVNKLSRRELYVEFDAGYALDRAALDRQISRDTLLKELQSVFEIACQGALRAGRLTHDCRVHLESDDAVLRIYLDDQRRFRVRQ